jgi:hypothetical protein
LEIVGVSGDGNRWQATAKDSPRQPERGLRDPTLAAKTKTPRGWGTRVFVIPGPNGRDLGTQLRRVGDDYPTLCCGMGCYSTSGLAR